MSVDSVSARAGVEQAIRRAADRTGVDFEFLMRTARRESALDPSARARTSSASGLFQFIEQTWLATLDRHGAEHGYGRYAQAISRGADGRYRVDANAREAVLNLRFDPQAASLMAAELASDHAAYLRGRIGREPSAGELYAAHFLGPAGAAELIQAADRSPGATAAALFPAPARANRPIFYRDGRAATVAEVYANLTRTGGNAPGVSAGPDRPSLARDVTRIAGAERLDRERDLLNLLMGEVAGGSAFSTQLLAAFGPEES